MSEPISHAAAARARPARDERLNVWLRQLSYSTAGLLLIGLAACFSTTVFLKIALDRPPYADFFQQLGFAALGLSLAVITVMLVQVFHPAKRWLKYLIPAAFFISLVLVAAVKFSPWGVSVYGATRAITVGSLTFQPSEFLKVTLVLYLAQILCWWRVPPQFSADNNRQAKRERSSSFWRDHRPVWPELPKRCIAVILLALGLTAIQPDLGTSSIIFGSSMVTLLLAGVNFRQLSLFIVSLAVLLGLVFFVMPGKFQYAMERIETWQNPTVNTDDAAYQITQSRGALAAGGIFGRGFLQSDQKMNRLPLSTKDFIYPVMVEELGYVGGVGIILLFLYLGFVGMQLSLSSRDPFNQVVIAALGFGLCLQAFVNIGTTIGTLPLSGLTLPFFSEGGTSLVVSLAAIGLMYALGRCELLHARTEARMRDKDRRTTLAAGLGPAGSASRWPRGRAVASTRPGGRG